MTETSKLPPSIVDEDHLDDMLSTPGDAAVNAMSQLQGDVILLGAAGKMGPTLAMMVKRASEQAGVDRRVIGVSRFSNDQAMTYLTCRGIETIRGDLLDERFIERLPDVANVIFMTGAKFGTSQNASFTWAMNTYLPALVCRRYAASRILAFSTGNVYPFVDKEGSWSVETDSPNPVGEYGMSALGRERTCEYFSRRFDIPLTIVRLNYAVEMRYGVIVDLAKQILSGDPIDVSMGFANVIWQRDANEMTIASLLDANCPPFVVNVAGHELLNVKSVCEKLAKRFNMPVSFTGSPERNALLNNAQFAHQRYGKPTVDLDRLVDWTADWLQRNGSTHNKPTHFEVRTGQF